MSVLYVSNHYQIPVNCRASTACFHLGGSFWLIVVDFFYFSRTGVLMMFVTNNNLKAELKATPQKYENALDEAWRFLTTVRKVSELHQLKVLSQKCSFILLMLKK